MSMPELPVITGDGDRIETPAHKVNSTALYQLAYSRDTGLRTYVTSGHILEANIAPATTDLIVLRGSASRIVRVKSIEMHSRATAFQNIEVHVQKHTVANTGGTLATTPSITPLDSDDGAATATPIVYTGNPTIAGSATEVACSVVTFQPIASAAPGLYKLNFIDTMEHGLVLRGVAQELAINFQGVKPGAGARIGFRIAWTEENE